MSDKYIIRNCECKVKGKTTLCVRDIPYKKCENITDCILKQIVELCKKEIRVYRNTPLPNDGTNTLHFGRQSFAYDILKLLDIQEVE